MKLELALMISALVVVVVLVVTQTGFQVNCLAIDNIKPSFQTIKPIQGDSTTVTQIPIQATSSASSDAPATQSPPLAATPQLVEARRDYRRPVWALAHMVNSIKELDYRLGKGANAVEVDVTFGGDGDPLYTYHGPPCDCWRHCHQQEDFNEYLNYVREIAIDEPTGIGQNLSILFLDLKLDHLDQITKTRAGTELAKSITGNLFLDSRASHATILNNATLPDDIRSAQVMMPASGSSQRPPLHLIISINHVNDIDLVQNFIHYLEINNSTHLMDRIGFDVGMNDDIQQIESMWTRYGDGLHLWQGDGLTNCLSPYYNLQRLSKALSKRDSSVGYPAKVYHWTIDLHDRMRESLLMGVDAIMTNHPERLLAVLQEPEFAHDFRLADRRDDPFKKLLKKSVSRSGETARYQRSASSPGGGVLGNLYDVISSGLAYIREIPLLSFVTTTRLFRRQNTTNNIRKASQTAAQSKPYIFAVKTSGQPQYLMDPQNQTANQLESAGMSVGSSASDMNSTTNPNESYEGPKWYTSLASNMLVSIMNTLLPVP